MTIITKLQKQSREILLFTAILIIFAGSFLLFKSAAPISDEHTHYEQILDIRNGTTLLPRICPYLPGYHWTMAGMAWLLHDCRGPAMRFASTVLSFFCFIAFYLLARRVDRDATVQKSLLFILSPIFFPFFSLIYTDIYSMAFVFLAFFFALDRRLWLSGIAGILSILVRQNNIVWLVMIALASYIDHYFPQYRWKDVQRWIGKFFFFFLAGILLAAFVIWNKGFVLGDKTNHAISPSCGNLFFLLFFFFFLFLPLHLSNLRKILAFLKQNKMMGLVLAEVFLVYLLLYKANHPYNSMARLIHNWILWGMAGPVLTRCLYFLPIAYSILSLCVTPLRQRSFYLLYPFTILFLLPNAVIEIRYCFIPYALFLLFKEKDTERTVLFTLAIYLVGIGSILYLMKDQMFFL